MKTIKELDNEIKEIKCTIESLNIRLHAFIQQTEERFIRMQTNSMAQANANYDRWKDARDVDKAFEEWFADPKQTAFYRISPTGEHWFAIQSVKNFALYFAQRCGVEFTESINHIHLKDGVDVYKYLSDFVTEKNRTLPMHDADWLEFAQYFAKRCGVVLDRNSEIQNNH